MNVIFLTMSPIFDITNRGIYKDLVRKFRDEGHQVYIVTACGRSYCSKTELLETTGVHILIVRTLNLLNSNMIEKGVGQILLEMQYAIQRGVQMLFHLLLQHIQRLSEKRLSQECR